MRLVHDDARRCDLFQHLPMHGCVNHGVWRQAGARLKRRNAARKVTRHERRRCRTAVRRLLYRLENPRFAVDGPKEPAGLVCALRGAKKQKALRLERVVKRTASLGLQVAVEIDQEVPTRDEVDAREGRVLEKTVARE